MIKYVKKLIKKQRLLKKYKKLIRFYSDAISFKPGIQDIIYYSTQRFYTQRCYNRLKKL